VAALHQVHREDPPPGSRPGSLPVALLCFASVIGRVSYLIYVSMRHYVLTTSGDIVVCFHTAVCFSC